jgi:hypothetical protein
MKQYTIAGVLVGCLFVASMASASTLFGQIQRFGTTTGITAARVGILMEEDTACPNNK